MIPLLILLACAATDNGGTDDGGATDDGGTTDDGGLSDGGGANELNGTVPPVAIDLPEFVATNRDGTGRSRQDVLGHPTVMWFYPAAGTSG